jgi:FkbM family methyltransferase
MEPIFDVIPKPPGRIWDVGSNVGIFSLKAAQMGHAVVAFDISGKALRLLKRAADSNRFSVTAVPRAFSVETFSYRAPDSCMADNRVAAAGTEAPERSITYLEAAESLGGTPQLIKMDIEGGEEAFLDSADFRKWLLSNRIAWVVELHRPEFVKKLWRDVPVRMLDAGHCLINGTTAGI